AWEKAGTCSNAISSFRATGVYPYNPNANPEYAYLVDEANNNELTVMVTTRRQPEQEEVPVPTVVPVLTTPERNTTLTNCWTVFTIFCPLLSSFRSSGRAIITP
ncbi:hypothetical protein HHI36_006632, partial [Cryptolaemus montrouzieri]